MLSEIRQNAGGSVFLAGAVKERTFLQHRITTIMINKKKYVPPEVVEKTQVPVVTTVMGRGAISTKHPFVFRKTCSSETLAHHAVPARRSDTDAESGSLESPLTVSASI